MRHDKPHRLPTNNKGQFSFQWGSSNAVFPEAGDPGPASTKRYGDLSGDSYSASVRGPYRSRLVANWSPAPLTTGPRSWISAAIADQLADEPDVGMMVLHRIANVKALPSQLYFPRRSEGRTKGVGEVRAAAPVIQSRRHDLGGKRTGKGRRDLSEVRKCVVRSPGASVCVAPP